jgi:hypothetical protein
LDKRYLALAGIGCGIAWFASGSMGSNHTGIVFTKPALPPPPSVELRSELSSAFVALPVVIGPIAQRAEHALPEQLVVVQDWLADAACAKRNRNYDCNSAKLTGTITRSGPVETLITPTGIKLVVPIKYDLTATGVGWASYLSEHKTGETRWTISFVATLNPAGGLEVAAKDETLPAETTLTLMKGTIKLARLIDPRLSPVLKSTEDDLRRTLAALPVKAATARAWAALSTPLELGAGSGMWLKGAPEYYAAGSFVQDHGQVFYRLAIAARMMIAEGDRGQTPAGKRQPVPAMDARPPSYSHVKLAVPVDLAAMRQATKAAFSPDKTLESRSDRFSDPVKVKVRDTRVYPAMRQIGLELDVEVSGQKGAVHTGKLNLVGRPVLDAASGTVSLADITFPAVSKKDVATTNAATNEVPRLGTEPFAGIFAASAKLDVSRALAEAMPRTAHMLSQRISDDMVLTARFTHAVPTALEMAGDGVWLQVDLAGDISFVFDGAAAASGVSDTMTTKAAYSAGASAAVETPTAATKRLLKRRH